MLVAIGLFLAAVELAWPRRNRLPEEPTRSLFAILLVLLARQMGDGARFLVFAFAAGGSAWLAGAGGTIGGSAALALGIAASGEIPRWPLRWVRLGLASVLATTAVVIGLKVRGLIA